MFQILPNLEWLIVINRISCPHFHDLWVLSDHMFLIFHSLQSVIPVLQIWISALAGKTKWYSSFQGKLSVIQLWCCALVDAFLSFTNCFFFVYLHLQTKCRAYVQDFLTGCFCPGSSDCWHTEWWEYALLTIFENLLGFTLCRISLLGSFLLTVLSK